MDFACKQFNLNDVIKCGLGLTKIELMILSYFLKEVNKECTSTFLAQKLKLNLTTIQKAVKKLSEKNIIIRYQKNLDKGGYVYTYKCNSKAGIRKIIKEIIKNWSDKVEKRMDRW